MKKELWSPSADRIKNSNMTRFARTVGRKYGFKFANYDDLYRWSVENIEQFWASIWDASGVIHSAPYEKVLSSHQMPGARWFEGARMNFARNLLKYRDDHPAIIHWDETGPATSLTYQELYSQVAACAEGLKKLGISRGDRVAAIMPNIPQTVIAMLATTSLGALWSSCSPDFGEQGGCWTVSGKSGRSC